MKRVSKPRDEEPPKIPGWPDKFSSDNRVRFERLPTELDAAWWADRFFRPLGLYPVDIAEKLCARAPGDKTFTYRYIDHLSESFDLAISTSDEVGRIWFHAPVLELKRDWFLWDRVEVSGRRRGHAIAKQLARDLYDVARMLEVSSIRIAAEDVGGYLWARAGFVPDKGAWTALAQHMIVRLTQFQRHLSPERFSQVVELVKRGADAPWLIHAVALLADEVPSGDPDVPGKIDLGKALLVGSEWTGTINLGNALERERFEEWLNS
jgi:hypothetical protein